MRRLRAGHQFLEAEFSALGGIALLIAIVGVAGVLAFSVRAHA